MLSELVKVGSCNHRGLYKGKRKASVSVKKTQLAISGLRMKRPPAKKQRRPLEGEKGKRADSPTECPEGTYSCLHLKFGSMKPSF